MSGPVPDDVTLSAMPALPKLYRSALERAVQRTAGRNRSEGGLPAARHRISDVAVDLDALTRFQHLLGAAARDQVPSAYLHTIAFPVAMSVLARPDFPLPLLGMVHLSNEVQQGRQVSAFERLDVVASVENLRPHRAGTQVDLVTVVEVAGERIWTGRSVYLARGTGSGTPGGSRRDEDRPRFTAPVPTGVWRLGAAIGRRYAAVSGDWNPIHLSGPTARALGMKAAVAHGMYLAARMVDQAVPAPSGALRWRIDFAAPVLLPATVTTSFARTDDRSPGGADGVGVGVDVVGWSARHQRPHFTGWVRTS